MAQTEQEIKQAALEWIHKHCPIELKTAETGGLTNEDSLLVGQFIQEHHGGVWSVASLNDAVEKLRGQLTWRSKADLEYSAAWQSLNADQQAHFTAWWNGPAKKYVRLDSEEGFANASRILTWAKNHTWSADVFDRACQNLFATEGLFAAPTRQQGEKRGHADDGKGFMPRETSTQYRGGKLNHAHQTAKPAEPTLAEAPDAWTRIIEGQLADGTHAQQQQSKELYTRLSAEGLSPRQISTELSKLQRSYKRLFSGTAV